MRFSIFLFLVSVTSAAVSIRPSVAIADDAADLFESEIRPVLVEKCSGCHGAKEQQGGLRVDSRAGLLKGGDNGPALVPRDAAASRLVRAIRREGDLKMPPETRLTEREVRAFEKWIELAAPWPKSAALLPTKTTRAAADHWAFQPVVKPAVPATKRDPWVKTPVDAFVLARLRNEKLAPSPAADRRTLIRRTSYALTGLPPTLDQIEQFANDADPHAFDRLVDLLLDSPQYGEQWARHWLDVARYSDTKGYVYAREERFWTHAWSYRDWVVRALNDDLPYDRFLLLQLAADQVEDRDHADLAAMGFLTLGRRFLGVQNLIIDDRIDVVTRGMLGLTASCARCHDHKYDPIPTADYYSLYGVFASSAERLVCLDDAAGDEAYRSGLAARRGKLESQLATRRRESSARVRSRVADYLHAQTELEKYPADGFDQIFEKTDMLPAFVRRWESYLHEAERTGDPIFSVWHKFARLSPESFADRAAEVCRELTTATPDVVHPLVAAKFREPPQSFDEVIRRYGQLFAQVEADWQAALQATNGKATSLPGEPAEQLRRVLYGPTAPCEVPDQPIVHTETCFDSGSCTELWKLQGEMDRWIIRSSHEVPFAVTLVDRPAPVEPRIFRRGNPIKQGDHVPRQFLAVLSGDGRRPFQRGSGRLELARAIIDPANPLTARVMVNRVWAHHFGRGLVMSPSDFGMRAGAPSHPELLDWLTARFIESGWSLKQLHRWIVRSATFQQAATGVRDESVRRRAAESDPDNRLLWRMSERRLTFEELRDSMLAASGELELRRGGKPADLFKQPFPKRRTLYGLVDRQFLPGTLRVFDFANPDLHIARRRETTVPQQALFFLNHPLVLERARAVAASCSELSAADRVRATFRRILQRDPTSAEVGEALGLTRATAPDEPVARPTTADWRYGLGSLDEAQERVAGFTSLPHFTGAAWQGGSQWPDQKLGWVQLTATGGHPGNDRKHASIRRWQAPRDMTVRIESKLVHEAAPGDGIRAFIVSSTDGLLQSAVIHQKTVDLNVASLAVKAGATIDFVVDIDKVLNSDQYLWEATISESGSAEAVWNSRLDFPAGRMNELSPWEQLAHVLFCTNEFLFVD